MPGSKLESSQKVILDELVKWHQRHKPATRILNPGRWADARPQFIRELEDLFDRVDLDLYLAGERATQADQEFIPRPKIDNQTKDLMPPFASENLNLRLFFILEARLLRNSMSARNATARALVSSSYQSNSTKVHQHLSHQVALALPVDQRKAYQKIMRYMYLDNNGALDFNAFNTFINKLNAAEFDLFHAADLCEEAYHYGLVKPKTTQETTIVVSGLNTFIKDPGKFKDCAPRELGVHVQQAHQGHGYWQFASLAKPMQAPNPPNIQAQQKALAHARFRMFADFGRMPDNGLLSNKLINLFGKNALLALQDKAERFYSDRSYSKRNEDFETNRIQISQWMVDGIRAMQHFDLLLNCDKLREDERNTLFQAQKVRAIKELDALITEVHSASKSNNNSSQDLLYAKQLKTLQEYKEQLSALLNAVPAEGAFSHNDMLKLQQEMYRGLVYQFHRVQGYLSAQQNFFFENNDNSVLLVDAQAAIQDFSMAYGVRVTDSMLNRAPSEGEKLIDLEDMKQNKFGLFAAQLVDSCEPLLQAQAQAQAGAVADISGKISANQLVLRDRLLEVAIRHGRVTADVEKAHRDKVLREDYRSLLVREKAVFYKGQVGLIESDSQKEERSRVLDTLIHGLEEYKGSTHSVDGFSPLSKEGQHRELLKLARVQGRSSAAAIKLNDLGSASIEFFKDFLGYFERLGAQRPFVMSAAFSIPYMQFGAGAFAMFSSAALAQHLHAFVFAIAKGQAAILHAVGIPITGAEVNHIVTAYNKWLIHSTGIEGAAEAGLVSGVLTSQLLLTMTDSIVNGALNGREKQTFIDTVRQNLSHNNLEDATIEEHIKESISAFLTLSMQLSIAVVSGIGIHLVLAAHIPVLSTVAHPIGILCNVNPEIFAGPLLGNLVQKLFTTKTAGVIYAKVSEIVKGAERSEGDLFGALNQPERARRMKEYRIKAIAEFRREHANIAHELFEAHLGTDGDIKNIAEFNQAISELQDEAISINGKLTPLGELVVSLDLSYSFANSSAKPDPLLCKKNELKELAFSKQLRNLNRQVMQVDDADFKTLIYFIELANSSEQAATAQKNQRSFHITKEHFENLIFENPDLWRLFQDEHSMAQFKALGIERVKFSPLAQVGRFLFQDVLMRYGIGTLAAPFTALYVVLNGKDNVQYPFRQFLGTTLLPALYRTLFIFSLPILPIVDFIRHGFDISKFSLTKGVLNTVLSGVLSLLVLVKNAVGAMVKPFLYVVLRMPELIVAAALTNPLLNALHFAVGITAAAAAVVTAVVLGVPELVVGGFFKLIGSEKWADRCLDLFKAPYQSFSRIMRFMSNWRADHGEGPYGDFARERDALRAKALDFVRDTIRYPLENFANNLAKKIRDVIRIGERQVQKNLYQGSISARGSAGSSLSNDAGSTSVALGQLSSPSPSSAPDVPAADAAASGSGSVVVSQPRPPANHDANQDANQNAPKVAS